MLKLALTFFLIANPIGNSPAIIALVKDFDLERQKKILFRESIVALILALFFQYGGELFLTSLNIQDYVVTLAGGILLTLVALKMIFPPPATETTVKAAQEPFIVPIATPIISGPGLLAMIMLKSQLAPNPFEVSLAILVAWIGVIAVLVTAPYLQKIIGRRGLLVLEQVMGMLLALVSIEMLVKGGSLFIKAME